MPSDKLPDLYEDLESKGYSVLANLTEIKELREQERLILMPHRAFFGAGRALQGDFSQGSLIDLGTLLENLCLYDTIITGPVARGDRHHVHPLALELEKALIKKDKLRVIHLENLDEFTQRVAISWGSKKDDPAKDYRDIPELLQLLDKKGIPLTHGILRTPTSGYSAMQYFEYSMPHVFWPDTTIPHILTGGGCLSWDDFPLLMLRAWIYFDLHWEQLMINYSPHYTVFPFHHAYYHQQYQELAERVEEKDIIWAYLIQEGIEGRFKQVLLASFREQNELRLLKNQVAILRLPPLFEIILRESPNGTAESLIDTALNWGEKAKNLKKTLAIYEKTLRGDDRRDSTQKELKKTVRKVDEFSQKVEQVAKSAIGDYQSTKLILHCPLKQCWNVIKQLSKSPLYGVDVILSFIAKVAFERFQNKPIAFFNQVISSWSNKDNRSLIENKLGKGNNLQKADLNEFHRILSHYIDITAPPSFPNLS